METRPPNSAPRRRNRSAQRERILAWLRANDAHPTASQVHTALAAEMPLLSLGTVYRNLEVLVAEGQVNEVPSPVGATRYDGNLEPHHHFNCEGCDRILDVALPVPRGLGKRLSGELGLEARRIQISFFGLCSRCEPVGSDAKSRSVDRAISNTRKERHG